MMEKIISIRRISTILVLAIVLSCADAICVSAATYFNSNGTWQGYYDLVDVSTADTMKLQIKYGLRHNTGTLAKATYQCEATASTDNRRLTVSGAPNVPTIGGSVAIGTITVNIPKTREPQDITIKIRITNTSSGAKTDIRTLNISVPAIPKYTIQYFATGCTNLPRSQTVWYGESVTLSQIVPYREGYTFVGWKDSTGISRVYNPGDTLRIGTNLKLIASWEKIKETEAEISVRNTLLGGINNTPYNYQLVPVKGWLNEASDTLSNGTEIRSEELPMPEESDMDRRNKIISIRGDDDEATGSFGRIIFEKAGWYMYRVSEVIPDPRSRGIRYDETSYYVVVYVVNDDTGGVAVRNVISWHNSKGADNRMPNLSDVSRITDNGSAPSAEPGQGVYGKTGYGDKSVQVTFWNGIEEAGIRISKNVRGSLGDRSALFEFRADITGLTPGAEYGFFNDGMVAVSGFDGTDAVRANASGEVHLVFRLADDDFLEIEKLPAGAIYTVAETESNHVANYRISECGSEIDSASNDIALKALSTGMHEIHNGAIAEVEFDNDRSIAVVTGLNMSAAPLILLIVLLILIVGFYIFIGMRSKRNARVNDDE